MNWVSSTYGLLEEHTRSKNWSNLNIKRLPIDLMSLNGWSPAGGSLGRAVEPLTDEASLEEANHWGGHGDL